MIVEDIMELVKIGPLFNIAVAKNDNALIKYINLGVSELYRRFNLAIKVETVVTNPDLNLYELRNKDVSMFLGLYDSKGIELKQTDILDAKQYDYKIMNYRSFLLKKPKNDLLFAVYIATPVKLKNKEDEIDLPDSMIDALLTYVAYMGHSTINKDNTNESTGYYNKFIAACNELEMQGYKVSLSNETINMALKGYV